MARTTTEVLLIEDDARVADTVAAGLRESGYHVHLAGDGEEGLYRFTVERPALVVLDLNLPRRDGIEILKALRRLDRSAGVLIVSARDTVEDRINGLEAGADDYLVKPFAFAELLARLRSLARRNGGASSLYFTIADLEIAALEREVRRAGKRIDLTPREFAILELLARNQDSIVARRTIAEEVWRVRRATPLDNVIDVHLMHLRRKIDREGLAPLIHTIRGVGVMLSARLPAP